MRFRYPDHPIHIYSLGMIREGEYMSQPKWDGHFVVIIKDFGKIITLSRHNKPLPVTRPLVAQLESMNLKNGTTLHGEWTSRRESNTEESIRLFSAVYSDFKWLGGDTEENRFNILTDVVRPTEAVTIVENRMSGYANHYRETVDNPKLEGIVLKRRNAKLIGDPTKPKDNPAFLKLKWRDAADGQFRSVISDENLVTMP